MNAGDVRRSRARSARTKARAIDAQRAALEATMTPEEALDVLISNIDYYDVADQVAVEILQRLVKEAGR